MARAIERHIDDEELELLLKEEGEGLNDVRAHIASCSFCADKFACHWAGKIVLEELPTIATRGGSECPAVDTWRRIATGDLADSGKYLEHAASCLQCGFELKAALGSLASEDAGAAAIPDLMDEKSHALAKRLAANWSESTTKVVVPKTETRFQVSLRVAIMGALAATILLAIGIGLLMRPPHAEQLIAKAYSEQRTVEFRIPGADHAPIRVERGPERRVNSTASLLEAEAVVERALEKDPNNPDLLQQKARIQLLNWDYNSALRLLSRVVDKLPDKPQIVEDIALAYFERAEAENRPIDFGSAVENLGRILKTNPNDRIALFNRAIALEHLMMYREAAVDWNRFLQVENKGGWAAEARDHLADVQKRLNAQATVQPCEALSASTVVQWERSGTLDQKIEMFQGSWSCLRQRILVEWLPGAAGSGVVARVDRDAVIAGDKEFRKASSDTWIGDLLTSSRADGFQQAVAALGKAVAANLAFDSGQAEIAAKKAEQLFRQIGNRAGVAKALIEYDYANRRSQHPSECDSILTRVELEVSEHPWVWTSLEYHLEKSACISMAGDHDAEVRELESTLLLSQSPLHTGLRLRTISYLAGAEEKRGDHARAWSVGTQGLREAWSEHEFPFWTYQIYYQLAVSASQAENNLLALQLQRETLSEIRRSRRPSLEAFTWFDLGRTAMLAGSIPEARNALTRANSMFRRLPNDRALRTVLADCNVYLAEVENQQNHARTALARLRTLATEMAEGNSFVIELHYRRAIAQSHRLLGSFEDYQRDLEALLQTCERGLALRTTLSAQMQWARDTGDAYREYTGSLAFAGNNPEGALDAWEWFRAAPFRRSGAKLTGLTRGFNTHNTWQTSNTAVTLARLGVEQAIVYVALDDDLLIWLVRNGAVHFYSVPVSRRRLANAVRRLYLLCSDPETSEAEWRSAAGQLGQYLLAPVEASLSLDKPLWVEMDDALASTPFGVLPLVNGELIGLRCPLAVFPGSAYLERAGKISPILKDASVLSVGIASLPKDAPQGMVPLPGAALEAEEVAREFPRTHTLLDGEATLTKIKRELPSVVVFHFAGHARSTADQTSLLLNGAQGFTELDAETIAAMNLKTCRLAVISACSAEAPEFFRESRPFGFAIALLSAGASSALLTRWNLDSDTGVNYMREFLRHLRVGKSALLAASLAAQEIGASSHTRHPYYWAAYQFFGRG